MKRSACILIAFVAVFATSSLFAQGPAAMRSETTEIILETRGAYFYKAKGFYVLKLEMGEPLTIVLDPQTRTYTYAEWESPDHLFYGVSLYSPWKGKSPTIKEVSGWELTPMRKRKPCPLKVSKAGLCYQAKDGTVIGCVIEGWRNRLSPNCFEGLNGELIIRCYMPKNHVDGSSSGDVTTLEGWDYQVVDASAYDYKWQNTLGLRAHKKKDYQKSRSHFERSLKADSTYRHANFNLACALSLLELPFAQGKKYLEAVLKNKRHTKAYLRKIAKDQDLRFWRNDPSFKAWFAQWKQK